MGVLVGKQAPGFTAKAVQGSQMIDDFTLEQFKGQYVVLFFYPLDFTFVCPTELHAFQARLKEFQERNCAVVGCSVDSHHSHHAWLRTPKARGGVEGIEYPIISDINKTIARDYDVLKTDEGIAYRGLFLIDKEGIVRHQVVNDLPLGRSVDEALRVIDALLFFEKNGEVCPANWRKGERGMAASQSGLETYFGS
jgi:peroxiredoxin 2/4